MKNIQLKKFYGLILTIFLISTLMPSTLGTSTYQIIENSKESSQETLMNAGIPIYIGEIYIDGDGNKENAIVRATSEQSLEIPLSYDGEDVEFKIRYYMSCRGFNDRGKAHLWIRGADSVEAVTGEYEEGYLYTTLPDCNRGDTVEWVLTATYYYIIGLIPLVDVDAGAGVFSYLQSNGEMSSFQLFNTLINTLATYQSNNVIAISGTIAFK